MEGGDDGDVGCVGGVFEGKGGDGVWADFDKGGVALREHGGDGVVELYWFAEVVVPVVGVEGGVVVDGGVEPRLLVCGVITASWERSSSRRGSTWGEWEA